MSKYTWKDRDNKLIFWILILSPSWSIVQWHISRVSWDLFYKSQFFVTTKHWKRSKNWTAGLHKVFAIYQASMNTRVAKQFSKYTIRTYYWDCICSKFPGSMASFRHDSGSSCLTLRWLHQYQPQCSQSESCKPSDISIQEAILT